MTSKKINGWLIFNWKSGSHRTRKSKPDDLGTYEQSMKLDIEVEIPEVAVPELAAQVQIPQPAVRTAVVESVTDETFPEWSDVADEVVGEAIDDGTLGERDRLEAVDDLVEQLTTRVLVRYDGVADVETVYQYVEDQVKAVYKQGVA